MRQDQFARNGETKWALVFALAFSPCAFAQTTTPAPGSGTRGGVLITGQHPFDNVTGGLANRGPGHMVSQGVAAQQAAADFARGEITITETHQTSVQAQALVDVINALFDGLNQALITLGNALFTRLGLPPGSTTLGTGSNLLGSGTTTPQQ